HGGIQINDVQPGIILEFLQEAENIGDREFALPPVHQLNGLSALKINAGNQHGSRTSTPWEARNSFSPRMDCAPSWKMEAASAASPAPSWKISAKCAGDFAPPDAITGTDTAIEIAAVSAMSNPLCVPSRSTEVKSISPPPQATAILAHSRASREADSRPPRTMTSQ